MKNPDLQKIIIKAIKDEAFRKELKKNPRKVIEKELATSLPKELKIEIVEQPKDAWVIVIPELFETKKLSEKDLQNLAGGMPPPGTISWCANACGK